MREDQSRTVDPAGLLRRDEWQDERPDDSMLRRDEEQDERPDDGMLLPEP